MRKIILLFSMTLFMVTQGCLFSHNDVEDNDSSTDTSENQSTDNPADNGNHTDTSNDTGSSDSNSDTDTNLFTCPDTQECDDALFCNGLDSCKNNTCSKHTGNPCSDGEICNEDLQSCCTPQTETTCSGGDLYWVDSCDVLGEVKEDCPDLHSSCSGNKCICTTGWTGENCDKCVLYVDNKKDTYSANAGTSWDEPMENIQDAIDAAADDECQVWVATGSYNPTRISGGTYDSYKTFMLAPGVHLYGGFAGTENSPDKRSIVASQTILEGHFTATNHSSMHLVTGANDTLLDGFTLQNAASGALDGDLRLGCAIFIKGSDSTNKSLMKISNCVMKNNRSSYAGSVLYSEYANIEITGCSIYDNKVSSSSSSYFGGTLHIKKSSLIVKNSQITGNQTGSGGAIYADESNVKIYNSILNSNTANQWGGAIQAMLSEITMVNSIAAHNLASTNGGAINLNRSNLTIGQSTVFDNSNNSNDSGKGIIFVDRSSVDASNSILWNDAESQIIATSDAKTQSYINCDISHNSEGINSLIDKDPQFNDESADLLTLSCTEPGNPLLCSPCVDTGKNIRIPNDTGDIDDNGDNGESLPIDILGHTRISGISVDMGAVEFIQN